MTIDELREKFFEVAREEADLLCSKGADYSGREDVFGNFRRIAVLSRKRISPQGAMFVLLMKHIDAIARYVFERELSAESVVSHIKDARNYLFLLLLFLEGGNE